MWAQQWRRGDRVGSSDTVDNIASRSSELLQEHLRWEKAHVVGHSMGGMAAMKLAAMVPARVASLSVISSSGGGWQSVPSTWRAIRYAWRVCVLATRRLDPILILE